MLKKISKLSLTGLIVALILPFTASAASPAFVAKMKLDFQNDPSCELSGAGNKSNVTKGRGSLVHDENTISWTSSCLIRLPKSIKYCALTSHSVTNPEALVSWNSVYQKAVLQAKIASDSDINPGFGTFTVSYMCFE